MKSTLPKITTLFLAMTVAAMAGTDSKDMKEINAPETSDAGAYIGLFGGANFSQDYQHSKLEANAVIIPFTLTGTENHSTDHIGGVGGLKFGYNFQSFPVCSHLRLQPAVEAEAFYVGTETGTRYTANIGIPLQATFAGNQNNAVFALNGLLRLKTDSCFTPYFGGGIGAEYISLTGQRIAFSAPGAFGGGFNVHDSDDICLALQAIGGFDIEVAKHWTIFTEYKYLVAVDPSLSSSGSFGPISINPTFESNFIGQHIVTAGVKYNF